MNKEVFEEQVQLLMYHTHLSYHMAHQAITLHDSAYQYFVAKDLLVPAQVLPLVVEPTVQELKEQIKTLQSTLAYTIKHGWRCHGCNQVVCGHRYHCGEYYICGTCFSTTAKQVMSHQHPT